MTIVIAALLIFAVIARLRMDHCIIKMRREHRDFCALRARKVTIVSIEQKGA